MPASVIVLGTASGKAVTSLTLTTGAAVPAGWAVFLLISGTVTNTGLPAPTDSKSNLYHALAGTQSPTPIADFAFARDDGSGNLGAAGIGIKTALTATDTLTWSSLPSGTYAMAGIAVNPIDTSPWSEVSLAGEAVNDAGTGTGIYKLANGSSTSPSSGAGGASGQSYVALGIIATLGPSGDSVTGDSFTQFGKVGTSGGSATSNTTLFPGYLLDQIPETSATRSGTLSTSRTWTVFVDGWVELMFPSISTRPIPGLTSGPNPIPLPHLAM